MGALGDGHKWICNPSRIAEQVLAGKKCLIYSIGSNQRYDFEQAVLQSISKDCEIHTFDPAPQHDWRKNPNFTYAAIMPRINYHQVCVGPNSSIVRGARCKPMSQLVKELGHDGEVIDIFKIDCEGCEWASVDEWVAPGVEIRQINVELHSPKPPNPHKAHHFFQTLFKSGYVVHAKEPNLLGCKGRCIEYALIKMAPSFGVL